MYLEYVVLFIINIPIRRAETNARHRCNCAVSENPPKLLTNARIRTKYFVSNALLMLPSEYILSLLFIVVYCVTCHANSGDEFSSEFHLLNSKLPTHLRNQFPVCLILSFVRFFVLSFSSTTHEPKEIDGVRRLQIEPLQICLLRFGPFKWLAFNSLKFLVLDSHAGKAPSE